MAEFEVTLATDSIDAPDSVVTGLFAFRTIDDVAPFTERILVEHTEGGAGTFKQIEIIDEEIATSEGPIQLVISKTTEDAITVLDSVTVLKTESLTIDDARALNSRKIRIDFDRPVKINDALTDVASYDIQPVTAGAVPVNPLNVDLPVGQLNPTFVQIDTTEHTDAVDYSVALVGAIEGINNEPPGATPFTYEGIGLTPSVALVLAIDANTVEVQFNELMLDNDAIRDLARYSFDQGLQITEIESVFENVVTLKTSDQTPGVIFNLTVLGSDFLTSGDSDSIAVTDSVVAVVETDLIQAAPSDAVVVDDQVTVEFFKTILVEKAESIQVTDEVVVSFATGASQTDSVTVVDTVQVEKLPIGVSESIVVTDQVLRETDLARMFSDSVAVTDQVIGEIVLILPNQVVKGSGEDMVVIGSAEDIVIAGS